MRESDRNLSPFEADSRTYVSEAASILAHSGFHLRCIEDRIDYLPVAGIPAQYSLNGLNDILSRRRGLASQACVSAELRLPAPPLVYRSHTATLRVR
jgi:hypothetical protein